MNNGLKLGLGALVVVLVALGFYRMQGDTGADMQNASMTPSPTASVVSGGVKEFTMTSYYDPVGQKPHFSVPEIAVKKGDTVRIKVTNTFGMHNFKIDEFNVFANTPLNEEVIVEFVADKTGEFVYYCAMPGHRAAGQFGTLRVTE